MTQLYEYNEIMHCIWCNCACLEFWEPKVV